MMHDRVLVLYIWFVAAATIAHHREAWSLKHDSPTTDISLESPSSLMEHTTNNESSSEYGTSGYTTTEISPTFPPSSTDNITYGYMYVDVTPTSYSTPMSYTNSESSSEYSSSSEYGTSSEYSSTSEAYVSTTESLDFSTLYPDECDMSNLPIIIDSRQTHKETLDGILNIAREEFLKHKYFKKNQFVLENQLLDQYYVDINDTKLLFLIEEFAQSHINSPHLIHCEFCQYLKMKIPLYYNYEEIVGNILYIANDDGSSKIHIGKFEVIIGEITISITRQSYTDNITKNFDYGNIDVKTELTNMHEHRTSIVKEATVKLKQQIEENLKSISQYGYHLLEWYSDQIQSLNASFDICMYSKFRFNQAEQFLTLPQNGEFYYVINDYSFNSIGSVDLRMSKISIEGLSNFKSYTLTIYSRLNHSFSLEINDLSGYVDWTYITREKSSIVVQNTEKFKMESISLKGNNNSLTDISLSPTLQCVKSNDRFTLFATTILTEKMQDIITSSLNETITWCLNQPVETAAKRFYS